MCQFSDGRTAVRPYKSAFLPKSYVVRTYAVTGGYTDADATLRAAPTQ
jgi:hypothetical protein